MKEKVLAIGIGGTGAKIIEAVIHLAASGNTPQEIIPILIDQDKRNGNVRRCLKVIKNFKLLSKAKYGRFFNRTITTISKSNVADEDYLCIPIFKEIDFQTAIQYPKNPMTPADKRLLTAIYNDFQLYGKIDVGFKKRANMGSLIIEMMLNSEDNIINKAVNYIRDKSHAIIFICGSIFGGMGASGISKIGEHIRRDLPQTPIIGVKMLPYYKLPTAIEEGDEEDLNLLNSDDDILATKVALKMYGENDGKTFDDIFILGLENPTSIPTDVLRSGGERQENPAHVLELIAASAIAWESEKKQQCLHHVFMHSMTGDTRNGRYVADFKERDLWPIRVNVHQKNNKAMVLAKNMAKAVIELKEYPKVKSRTPWFFDELKAWATDHTTWWDEMANSERWKDVVLTHNRLYKKWSIISSQIGGFSRKADVESLNEALCRLGKFRYKEE